MRAEPVGVASVDERDLHGILPQQGTCDRAIGVADRLALAFLAGLRHKAQDRAVQRPHRRHRDREACVPAPRSARARTDASACTAHGHTRTCAHRCRTRLGRRPFSSTCRTPRRGKTHAVGQAGFARTRAGVPAHACGRRCARTRHAMAALAGCARGRIDLLQREEGAALVWRRHARGGHARPAKRPPRRRQPSGERAGKTGCGGGMVRQHAHQCKPQAPAHRHHPEPEPRTKNCDCRLNCSQCRGRV